MSKLFLTLIATIALAVAACGPGADPGTPGDPALDTPLPGDPGLGTPLPGDPGTDPLAPTP